MSEYIYIYIVWFTVRDGSISLRLLIPLTYLHDLFVTILYAHTHDIYVLILLLIIIIIIYHFYTGYLQIYACKNHLFYSYNLLNMLCFSHVECFVLLN
jgi:hypothetical protein